MFYRAIGLVVWKLALKQLRSRFGRQARAATALTLIGIAVAGYVAARSGE